LVEELLKAKNNAAVTQIGLEWCVNQCKSLMQFGVPAMHFYTMSNSEHTKSIAAQLF